MPRYFIEVAYKGTNYSGFQIQNNANTIQAEVEKALVTLYNQQFALSPSSRTDAGVHALQNFFHFDTQSIIEKKHLYNLNALLPKDIAAKNFFLVSDQSHCRFNAVERKYQYYIYQTKNPFLYDKAYYYPYPVDINLLNSFASLIREHNDFTSFSKRKTRVKTFNCAIKTSYWQWKNGCLLYTVAGNRFLRGMVKGLVGTMLRLAKANEDVQALQKIIEAKDVSKANFCAPAHALYLMKVNFKPGIITVS